ncbi:DNA-directed RNA polymerase, beta subunit [Syntrophotalea carbinolica DSM 2380]|uniref:DNA-directed RNA polymerase subunit beta n=2 Tax=Syntrophotalea carbinolica TaxID=19 RepID=RPOB_SYNC1|nr:DNA-directed RNA polymerase subunit beta [Syntrophotalea carbinolica]Q3A6Q4.1 RecName: Full=DNA-directed RNA polymerase subunit beta; Short=RNAP subunit beta; AltName: Full=RNA polymerase subunit beta; AltName: Full=Transcriptase subunit beta [Syntrophotalea carbinolica DSM 2380]ABA87953.1 DNA-directed RNA polymerase, beta subunit [Syntrophotalea carbinolica DSM 2380]
MAYSVANNQLLRKHFSTIKGIIEIPNLIDIQKNSYKRFLQAGLPPSARKNIGLEAVFRSVFPIRDFSETCSLDYVSYSLGTPKYDVGECHQRGMTFAAPVKVCVRLVSWDVDKESGVQAIRDIKEQEVYFGEIPLMTENGTFIINGTERVIVSQLHRSPGVFFDHDKGKTHSSGKILYNARVIPYRGSWLDFDFDHKDLLYVRIDRRRKLPATVLLKALGYSAEELLNYYYQVETVTVDGDSFKKKVNLDLLAGQRASTDVLGNDGEIIVKANRKFTKAAIRKLADSNVEYIPVSEEEIVGKVASTDIVDVSTGEVIVECNEEISESKLEELRTRGIVEFNILFIDHLHVGPYLRETLLLDRMATPEDARIEIYRRLRPGDPPTIKSANALFESLFFNPERYDLSVVGRIKLNYKLGLQSPEDQTTLTKDDILEVVRYLIGLRDGRGTIDDIDHLGNRRVRAVGELLENQYRVGLVRMERAIKERMSLQEVDSLMPHDLINSKPVSAVVKEFFGSSQLSQFMDQTNPLSEITHKRRLSALGPGGLTRERAGFEVRDVHPTHYGRVCPIETPEGPNIGLIASLSTYARINEHGFVETPYRIVEQGKVTNEIRYFSALEEGGHAIAQANAPLDDDGRFLNELVNARQNGEFVLIQREEIGLMDVSPKQLVSVAASLIPFLENDDANRALMGSNMQRQAVPLLRADAPLVGTGMERIVAHDSGAAVVARHNGVVESVDASRIVVKIDEGEVDEDGTGVDIYNLIKFARSNQNTCLNQKPIVKVGDRVASGGIIADGPSTEWGELALGQNVLVAFMPWEGYNFEDSILISEKLVKEDRYTSIHIEELECVARDTKLGKEEITNDIPNLGEDALKDLDESGIVRIGAEVKPGDILVGKITPKGETQLSPEEKLLRAIFGEKAGDVRDTSLRLPPGVEGVVIGARVFSRKGSDKDSRTEYIEKTEIEKLLKDQHDEIRIIRESTHGKLESLLVGQTSASALFDAAGKELLGQGEKITSEVLAEVPFARWREISLLDASENEEKLSAIMTSLAQREELIKAVFADKIEKIKRGDDLPPGVIKMVKVYIAIKRKLSVGDKMAGRHGNKGVLSRVLPEEDMPYMADGTPVEIVLNPLGVPSRMNVGQILETHLGLAARGLGVQIQEHLDRYYTPEAMRTKIGECYEDDRVAEFVDALPDDEVMQLARQLSRGVPMASPVFEGVTEEQMKNQMERAGFASSGQMTLYNGKTGEAFKEKVTVGIMYMLKLHHLVDDKIHARSIGPYSLVTQQPLGGKAQFGGQRLGEMEVWAMEAYGAAHALQEFLTVKSDDVTGRTRMYEAIVKGKHTLEAGLPESFNVLIKELQSLCLDVELLEEQE